MAQAILVQEQALANLQGKVQDLEQRAASQGGGGGFLSGLFGGGSNRPGAGRFAAPAQGQYGYAQPGYMPTAGSPWGRTAGGGGFLAGAMQTALGVAGGMLVADALTDAFSGGAAEASEVMQEGVGGLAQEAGFDELAAGDGGGEDFGGGDFGEEM
jgi:hypothetical protein